MLHTIRCVKFGCILLDENRRPFLLCSNCHCDFNNLKLFRTHLEHCDGLQHLFQKNTFFSFNSDEAEHCYGKKKQDVKEYLLHEFKDVHSIKMNPITPPPPPPPATKSTKSASTTTPTTITTIVDKNKDANDDKLIELIDIEESLLDPHSDAEISTSLQTTPTAKKDIKYNELMEAITPFVNFKKNTRTYANKKLRNSSAAKEKLIESKSVEKAHEKQQQESAIIMKTTKTLKPTTTTARAEATNSTKPSQAITIKALSPITTDVDAPTDNLRRTRNRRAMQHHTAATTTETTNSKNTKTQTITPTDEKIEKIPSKLLNNTRKSTPTQMQVSVETKKENKVLNVLKNLTTTTAQTPKKQNQLKIVKNPIKLMKTELQIQTTQQKDMPIKQYQLGQLQKVNQPPAPTTATTTTIPIIKQATKNLESIEYRLDIQKHKQQLQQQIINVKQPPKTYRRQQQTRQQATQKRLQQQQQQQQQQDAQQQLQEQETVEQRLQQQKDICQQLQLTKRDKQQEQRLQLQQQRLQQPKQQQQQLQQPKQQQQIQQPKQQQQQQYQQQQEFQKRQQQQTLKQKATNDSSKQTTCTNVRQMETLQQQNGRIQHRNAVEKSHQQLQQQQQQQEKFGQQQLKKYQQQQQQIAQKTTQHQQQSQQKSLIITNKQIQPQQLIKKQQQPQKQQLNPTIKMQPNKTTSINKITSTPIQNTVIEIVDNTNFANSSSLRKSLIPAKTNLTKIQATSTPKININNTNVNTNAITTKTTTPTAKIMTNTTNKNSSEDRTKQILNKLQTLGLQVKRSNQSNVVDDTGKTQTNLTLELLKKLQSKGLAVKRTGSKNESTVSSLMSPPAAKKIKFDLAQQSNSKNLIIKKL